MMTNGSAAAVPTSCAPNRHPADLPVRPLDVLRRRRSARWRTHPPDVVPLTLAEMDYDLAPVVAAALRTAVDRSDTGYAHPGSALGDAFSSFARERWEWEVGSSGVRAVAEVGVGVVELLRVVAHRRRVVINTPVYPPFTAWVREAGAFPVESPLADDGGHCRLDLAELERTYATGAAAHLLCHPHNPVGRIHTEGELAQVVELARRYSVMLISDEIHAPLTLPGSAFTPLLNVPGAAGVAVAVHSATKAFNLAGLKCAVIVSRSPVMQAVVDRLPADTSWRVGHFGVLATVAAYRAGGPWLDQLVSTLDRRRTQLGHLLAERLPSVGWQPPQAGYLAWLDCRALGDDGDLQRRWLDRGRVAVDAGSSYGASGAGFVRLNFATSAEILDHALAAMAAVVEGAGPPAGGDR